VATIEKPIFTRPLATCRDEPAAPVQLGDEGRRAATGAGARRWRFQALAIFG
jgi:hypothetical protein